MATDKRLDQVFQLTDFDYALIVKGTDVAKVTKQQLAELVGNLLYGATTKKTLASVVAEQIGIQSKNIEIAAKSSANLLVGRGLVLFDVNGGYECVVCAVSYWVVETIATVGDNIIKVSASSDGQTVTVTNLNSEKVSVTYRRFLHA